MTTQELLAIAAVTVAALFILVWFRRLATRRADDCDACRVKERSGRDVPASMHDCEIGQGDES